MGAATERLHRVAATTDGATDSLGRPLLDHLFVPPKKFFFLELFLGGTRGMTR
jgi:hypothetical protein